MQSGRRTGPVVKRANELVVSQFENDSETCDRRRMSESRNIALKHPITRKAASGRQIDMAIRLFDEREYACAITLALAAEDQLPEPSNNRAYLLGIMRSTGTTNQVDVNKIRNWLKHDKSPDEVGISEFDVFISILRATTKYAAVHGENTDTVKKFYRWVKQERFDDLKFAPSS